MTESSEVSTVGRTAGLQASAGAPATMLGQGRPIQTRIRWTQTLDRMLLSAMEEANPKRCGLTRRLSDRWNACNLPRCSATALTATLCKVRRKLNISPRNPEATADIAQAIASLHEIAEAAITSKPNQEAQGQGMTAQKLPEKQELVELLHQALQSMSAETEGDFSKRKRLQLKAKCGNEVIEAMQEAAEEFMEGECSLWQLNCLIHAMSSEGTQVKITLDRNEQPSPNHTAGTEIEPEAGNDEKNEIWGGGPHAEPEPGDISDTGESMERSRRKTMTKQEKVASRTLNRIQGVIKTQRKLTGLINAELERLQKAQSAMVKRELNCIVPVLKLV